MSNLCLHAYQQKAAKVHSISGHARFHACPSPCLPIKFTCHVCVWSSCHIIIARPDLAPGRCSGHLTIPGTGKGSWTRAGLRHPIAPQNGGPGAAIRRPRSSCTAHLSASVPTKAPRGRHYATHDRASPCRKISLTIPPHELSLKHIATAPLTPWPTD